MVRGFLNHLLDHIGITIWGALVVGALIYFFTGQNIWDIFWAEVWAG